jgi:hypothetical protein
VAGLALPSQLLSCRVSKLGGDAPSRTMMGRRGVAVSPDWHTRFGRPGGEVSARVRFERMLTWLGWPPGGKGPGTIMMGAGLEVSWLRLKRERAIASLSEQVSAPDLARCLQSDRPGRDGWIRPDDAWPQPKTARVPNPARGPGMTLQEMADTALPGSWEAELRIRQLRLLGVAACSDLGLFGRVLF